MNDERATQQAQKPKRLHLKPTDTYGKRSTHPRISVGALSGLAGIITLFVGAALSIAAGLAGEWWAAAWLQRIGIALLVLTVPLLAFGAHCFDCVDNESSAARKANEPQEKN